MVKTMVGRRSLVPPYVVATRPAAIIIALTRSTSCVEEVKPCVRQRSHFLSRFSLVQLCNAQAIQVGDLRCEYLKDPLGVDAAAPRLSWIIESPQRGQRQTAYQVLVASSPAALDRDQGDLWDSGKVASDETAQVVYAGKPLASRQVCYWKVRAWDRDGQPSDWSKPARWEMGLLKPADWSAQWIEADLTD